MKALLKLFQNWRGKRAATREAEQGESALLFNRLSNLQQDTVRQYFFAAANVMKMCDSIRQQHRAMDVDEILLAFRDAERRYVEAGFKPFFPPAIKIMHEFNMSELERAHLLNVLEPAEKAEMFASSMNRFVRRMIVKCQASMLRSSDFDRYMKPQS